MKKKNKVKDLTLGPRALEANRLDILYVLDDDPVKAARSLAIHDIKLTAYWIAESLMFKYLLDNAVYTEKNMLSNYGYRPKPFIYSTVYNIEYFSHMYEELIKIHKAYSGINLNLPDKFEEEDMLYNFSLASFKSQKEQLSIPDYRNDIKSKKKFARFNILGIDNPSNTLIDTYRLMYIVNGYPLNKFPCGAPEWYSPMRREVYRGYDKLSKKTFIIMTDSDGTYKYYYQHISNHMKEITDIKDMREFIDSLLFQQS